jgi:hypothetical protein
MFGVKNISFLFIIKQVFLLEELNCGIKYYNHNPEDSLNYYSTIMATQPVQPCAECKFSAEFLVSGGDRLCYGEFCVKCLGRGVNCLVAEHPPASAGKSIKYIHNPFV